MGNYEHLDDELIKLLKSVEDIDFKDNLIKIGCLVVLGYALDRDIMVELP